jgi:hypothetical protein
MPNSCVQFPLNFPKIVMTGRLSFSFLTIISLIRKELFISHPMEILGIRGVSHAACADKYNMLATLGGRMYTMFSSVNYKIEINQCCVEFVFFYLETVIH